MISKNKLKEVREKYDELKEDCNDDTREKMIEEYLEMTSYFEKKVSVKDKSLRRIIQKHNTLVGEYNELLRGHITLAEQYNSIILLRRGVDKHKSLTRK